MSAHHELKCWTEYFAAVKSGRKNFEVRYNDRGFQAGDTVELHAYHRIGSCYDSDEEPLTFRIGYVYPLPDGKHVVFSLLGTQEEGSR